MLFFENLQKKNEKVLHEQDMIHSTRNFFYNIKWKNLLFYKKEIKQAFLILRN